MNSEESLEEQRKDLRTDVCRTIKRCRRKARNIQNDLKLAETRDAMRKRAELIIANLYQLKSIAPGGVMELLDYHADPPTPLTIQLEPRETAQQRSDKLFRRAKKLERTEQIALERLQATEQRLNELEEARRAIEAALSERDLDTLRAKYRVPRAQKSPEEKRKDDEVRLPYRTFLSSALEIRVGRSAKDNDALTLHNAKPYDLWFHVRGTPGSHVILRLRRGQQPPPEAIIDAATLAVHFSNARQKHAAYKSPVEVQYTERRFVRKVRHAPPGSVLVQRETVLLLEVEPARLKRLLESER